MEQLVTIDLIIKVLAGFLAFGMTIFSAGKTWGVVSKLVGSVEAIHRRMTEEEVERRLRNKEVDDQLVNIRLDIRALQTWKNTLRFRPMEPQEER
jgi:hypothetical protein